MVHMNSFEHIKAQIDAVFVFCKSNHGHYICNHSKSMPFTLQMLQLQKVLALHTFEACEQIENDYQIIRRTMGIATSAALFEFDDQVALVCAHKAKQITHEVCYDLCAWIEKMSECQVQFTNQGATQNVQLNIVKNLEKLCAEFAKENSAEYVLINVLYENHYASIASYPHCVDGLWSCHSVCHKSEHLTHNPVSFENHPFELSHTLMYYSGVVNSENPTVTICALSYKQESLVECLLQLSNEADGPIKILRDAGLLSYEYWMWRYMKPFYLHPPTSKRCCVLM